jgi:hypothetical protein
LRVFNLLHDNKVLFFVNSYKENVPGSSNEHLMISMTAFCRHEAIPVGMPVEGLWIVKTRVIQVVSLGFK